MNKQKFEDYIHAGNIPGSGKASSYVRALDLLSEMLKAHTMGFADCQKIWNVKSAGRIESLYRLALAESKKGNQSKWNLPGIPKSYLQNGYCSAALKAYQQFLEQYNL